MKFQFYLIAACVALVSARGKSSKKPNNSGNDDDSKLQGNDKILAEMYTKMKGASAGVAINLDSTFGGGRCNCICKDNNWKVVR